MSNHGLEALYELRSALRLKPEADEAYTHAQIERILQAKNSFRRALRNDVILLYGEEIDQQPRAE